MKNKKGSLKFVSKSKETEIKSKGSSVYLGKWMKN